MHLLLKYFPHITEDQKTMYRGLYDSYHYWNNRINVISRKDFPNFYLHHVLYSLAIAKVIRFVPGTTILDVGTGGGFPGIPLAVFFPDVHFVLLDSVRKKLKVIEFICKDFNLNNITTRHARIEQYDEKFDFVVSRAVTKFPRFVNWVKNNIVSRHRNELTNGILYLKGGDVASEIRDFREQIRIYPINRYYREEFFRTKKLLYLPFEIQ
ncbi:MAG: 16S rRNA (guanine(527)-N(7))-methyltransferase RsmG [Bacteroidales bacterium]|nr:16S rRNA (guanine(527)-N(7))-methyltransferase RsmG [Bacteroidales bacterium]